jgi:hypothetical protein
MRLVCGRLHGLFSGTFGQQKMFKEKKMTDSALKSAITGRLGASILAIVALILTYFGVDLVPDVQESILESMAALAVAGSAVLAVLSKLREMWRTRSR